MRGWGQLQPIFRPSNSPSPSPCSVISGMSLFKSLGRRKLEEIAAEMHTINYRPGSYICEQGAVGHNLHVMLNGSCRVTKTGLAEDGSVEEKTIGLIHGDGYFGEIALIDTRIATRTANVVAIGNVTTMTLRRSKFDEIAGLVRPRIMKDAAIRVIKQVPILQKRSLQHPRIPTPRRLATPPPHHSPPPPSSTTVRHRGPRRPRLRCWHGGANG